MHLIIQYHLEGPVLEKKIFIGLIAIDRVDKYSREIIYKIKANQVTLNKINLIYTKKITKIMISKELKVQTLILRM